MRFAKVRRFWLQLRIAYHLGRGLCLLTLGYLLLRFAKLLLGDSTRPPRSQQPAKKDAYKLNPKRRLSSGWRFVIWYLFVYVSSYFLLYRFDMSHWQLHTFAFFIYLLIISLFIFFMKIFRLCLSRVKVMDRRQP